MPVKSPQLYSFNASSFTARVGTSTQSDIYSATVAGIGALKGPLHGGANEMVMHMTQEIADPAKAEQWMLDALAQKKKVMLEKKKIYPNLNFPAGPAYFVMARTTGWSAHIMEQTANNRIIRPLSEYVGAEQRKVMPLSERK